MAKSNLPAKVEPMGVERASTVSVVRPEDKGPKVPVPVFLRGYVLKEAPGLSPTVNWLPFKDHPQQCVFGYFIAQRDDVGPNQSNLYSVADFKSGEIIGVWGGTVLDNKMAQLNPKSQDLLLIQYVGDLPPKAAQKAARDFRVAVVQA